MSNKHVFTCVFTLILCFALVLSLYTILYFNGGA